MKEIETYFCDFNNLVYVEKRKFWIYPKYSIFYFSRISLISQIHASIIQDVIMKEN